MKREDEKVTCYSCGEKIDSEHATSTDQGFLCDECYYQLEEEEEYYDEEEEELDFVDDSDGDDDEHDELDFVDDDLDDD